MTTELYISLAWWHWYLAGILLLILELFIPGAFCLWVGIGAGVTGVLVQLSGLTSWQAQSLLFAALSLISLFVGKRLIRRTTSAKHDTLNRRLTQYIGESSVLEQPISNGHGRARFGDILWRVRGRDCPEGTRVTVTGVDGSDLLVEPDRAGEEKTKGPDSPVPSPGLQRGLF